MTTAILQSNMMTAREMALVSHNLSHDAKYARKADRSLWTWSDTAEAWKQVDKAGA